MQEIRYNGAAERCSAIQAVVHANPQREGRRNVAKTIAQTVRRYSPESGGRKQRCRRPRNKQALAFNSGVVLFATIITLLPDIILTLVTA
ncbi:hypothetical protein GY45DRAFT_319935 [Cubamyces sp. BRFM 1775]|nr:hypothetical protein GY45DRAFT_319935 [Cubamyces sp. BRFM 1775]